jgi:hypothetical protein
MNRAVGQPARNRTIACPGTRSVLQNRHWKLPSPGEATASTRRNGQVLPQFSHSQARARRSSSPGRRMPT